MPRAGARAAAPAARSWALSTLSPLWATSPVAAAAAPAVPPFPAYIPWPNWRRDWSAPVPAFLLAPVPALLAAFLGWTLLQLALIDFKWMLLPDRLTLPLLVAGLAVAALAPAPAEVVLPSIEMAFFGAALGYAVFCLTALLYERIRGRMGLGGGDAKLIAAAGAWLGPMALPDLVLVGSLSALAVAVASGALRRPGMVLPFGPHLALAFWLVYLRAQI